MLGNLRPELRSTYKTTQLIACVSSTNIKKYGFGPILDHFIKDINILSQVSFNCIYILISDYYRMGFLLSLMEERLNFMDQYYFCRQILLRHMILEVLK